MSVIVFLLVLSVLVIIHELGHFLTAKWAGMKVEEFGVGYPPKAATLFTDKKGTEYTLNWLPFGGFVRLFGEDGVVEERSARNEAFFMKPIWKRLIVVLSGAAVNFLFGVVAFGAIYTVVGIPTEFDYVLVEDVVVDSPADASGLVVGDKVVSLFVDGEETGVLTVDEFIEVVGEHRGEEVGLRVEGREELVDVYVRKEEEIPEGEGSIGVVISNFGLVHYPGWQMPFRGMVVGLESAVNFGGMLIQALGDMVQDIVMVGKLPEEVAGPVGIVHTVSREGILEEGVLAVINFAAILSINLAIINVLPFPALDGGRALFLMVELVSGRRIKPRWEQVINMVGFTLLIGMILVVSVRDVMNVFADEAVKEWFSRLISN